MHQNKSNNKMLIVAILFATIAISGSAIFLGLQYKETGVTLSTQSNNKFCDKVWNKLLEIEKYVKGGVEDAPETCVGDDCIRENIAPQPAIEQSVDKATGTVSKVSIKDHVKGDKSAKISLIEYSDFVCPFCKRFHPTPKGLIETYKGKVNWVYRHYPLPFHEPSASQKANASECANELGGNDKFWEYTDALYENQEKSSIDDLVAMATTIGLNKTKFQKCLTEEKYKELIQKSLTEGAAAGVDGTPGTIIYNNQTGEGRIISGAYPIEEFEKVINKMLGAK